MKDEIKNHENLVWYACYGSNIMYERFMCYIQGGIFFGNNRSHTGCNDKTPPRDSKAILIPYEMYFGKESKYWEGKGVAFLDIKSKNKAITIGRMYLITEVQFKEISEQEGKWYKEIIELDEFEGYPVKTLTNSERCLEKAPSNIYLDVIQKGIKEIFPEVVVLN